MSFLARSLSHRTLLLQSAVRHHVSHRMARMSSCPGFVPTSMTPSFPIGPRSMSTTQLHQQLPGTYFPLRPVQLPKFLPSLLDTALWLIKRTFQPSIIRKKRKTGFLVRQRTVGGRRTLNRRRNKGRMRLGGGI